MVTSPSSRPEKWPKVSPALTDEEVWIGDDWMYYWHQINKEKYSGVIDFGHAYVALHRPDPGDWTLEIGAGLGEQITYEEDAPTSKYIAVEYRWNMARAVHKRFPAITTCLADCQGYLPFRPKSMARVIAIHVLEHLPNLPACLRAIAAVLKESGLFLVVIPCEGGMAYEIARALTSRRVFERRYRTSYKAHMRTEHVNNAWEILEELERYFVVKESNYYPFRLPWIHLNAAVGMTLTLRA